MGSQHGKWGDDGLLNIIFKITIMFCHCFYFLNKKVLRSFDQFSLFINQSLINLIFR